MAREWTLLTTEAKDGILWNNEYKQPSFERDKMLSVFSENFNYIY